MKIFKKKRTLSILLALCLALSLLPGTALAEGTVASGFCGTADAEGNSGNNLTWTLDGDTLTISGTGEMREEFGTIPGGRSNAPWAAASFKKVVIEDGVTSIGGQAFSNLDSIETVEFKSGSVRKIGFMAFSGCSNLKTCVFKEGLEEIAVDAFLNCIKFSEITIPSTVTFIGGNAFLKTYLISNPAISPANVYITDLEKWMNIQFGSKSTNDRGLNLGSSYGANPLFKGTLYLNNQPVTRVTYSEGIAEVNPCAFDGCYSLTSVTLPASVKKIGHHAFAHCANLGNIDIQNVTDIRDFAFGFCEKLESITLSTEGVRLWDGAFYASGLKSVTVPGNAVLFDERDSDPLHCFDSIFYGCQNLATVTLGEGLTVIPRGMFGACDAIHSINIPDGVTTIGNGAFCMNTGSVCTDIYIPASVSKMEARAIGNFLTPYTVHFSGTEDQWNAIDMDKDGNFTVRDEVNSHIEQGRATIEFSGSADHTHSWDGGVVTREVNCGFDGTITYTCTGCGVIRGEAIPATGEHIWDEVSWSGDDSRHWHLCTICSRSKDVAAHSYSSWTVERPATATEHGKEYRACSVCGHRMERAIPATGGSTPDTPTPPPAVTPNISNVSSIPGNPSGNSSTTTAKPASKPEESPQPGTPAPPETPSLSVPAYADVPSAAWYSEAASYVSAHGLMTGTASTEFAPEANMTRAMVWTVLGRLDGADVSGSGAAWYDSAQAWSRSKGVSDGSNPNGSVTREELVTMLWRYMGSPAASADLSRFSDSASVSGWASAAVQWAVSAGLLEGSGGHLNPNGTATRAEVAAILMRFCENAAQ